MIDTGFGSKIRSLPDAIALLKTMDQIASDYQTKLALMWSTQEQRSGVRGTMGPCCPGAAGPRGSYPTSLAQALHWIKNLHEAIESLRAELIEYSAPDSMLLRQLNFIADKYNINFKHPIPNVTGATLWNNPDFESELDRYVEGLTNSRYNKVSFTIPNADKTYRFELFNSTNLTECLSKCKNRSGIISIYTEQPIEYFLDIYTKKALEGVVVYYEDKVSVDNGIAGQAKFEGRNISLLTLPPGCFSKISNNRILIISEDQ